MVDCKICEHPYCQYAGEQRGFVINCTNYMPRQKPQTNADRIRAMSDEELAEFLWFFDKKETARECVVLDGGIAIMTRRQLVNWLRQPVKDGDN